MVKRIIPTIGSQGMKILKPLERCGYFYIVLSNGTKRINKSIHRLVMETFSPIENMLFYDVHHKDSNKLNNKLENLEWKNSTLHNGMHHQNIFLGEGNPNSKLTKYDVIEIKKLLYKQILTQKQIAGIFNVNQRTVSAIKCEIHWNTVQVVAAKQAIISFFNKVEERN